MINKWQDSAIGSNNAPLPTLDSPTTESIVFRRDNTKGVFHKHVVSRDIITNHRIIHTTDYNNYSPQIILEDLDDVLTMNSSPNGNYQYFGTSIASRYHIRSGIMTRCGYGNIISTRHRTSADILFIKDGKPQIIFSNVRNAQDVVKLTKSMRKLRLQHHQHQQQ